MATLQEIIAQIEGYNTPGTIANRNNNPGNLRYAPTQVGQEQTVNGKFATFATPQDGWNALDSYIADKANNGVSVRDFVYTYAPPNENDTSGYLNFVAGQLGVSADSSLSGVLGGSSSVDNLRVDGSVGSDMLGSSGNGYLVVGIGILVAWLVAR